MAGFAAGGKSVPKVASSKRSTNGVVGARASSSISAEWPTEEAAHSTGIPAVMKCAILGMICALAFFIRLFAVVSCCCKSQRRECCFFVSLRAMFPFAPYMMFSVLYCAVLLRFAPVGFSLLLLYASARRHRASLSVLIIGRIFPPSVIFLVRLASCLVFFGWDDGVLEVHARSVCM